MRILLVEDEDDIREVAQIALGLDPGFEIRACASGHEALPLAAEWKPDLILLDVMMPGIDGPETLARLRQDPVAGATTVVCITARTQADELRRLRGLGVAGIIAKPFDPMKLAASVRAFLPS